MPGYSIYIHVPFCRRRCVYCDFVSHVVETIPASRYADAIAAEILQRRSLFLRMSPLSVYVGGGTPSLLPVASIHRMIAASLAVAQRDIKIEVTVEINPGDVDMAWLCDLRACGVNRLSVGVQAMTDNRLVWLGRRHTVSQSRQVMDAARKAGFDNVSVDFIYGSPLAFQEDLKKELGELVNLGADHISAYELTVSPHTPLGRSTELTLRRPDELADMWDQVGGFLNRFGYGRYEVSNYARPSKESVHNRHYWDGGFYIGAGVGAHGCVPVDGRRIRYANTGVLDSYLSIDAESTATGWGKSAQTEEISEVMHVREQIMMGLRRVAGMDQRILSERLPERERQRFAAHLQALEAEGFLTTQGERLVPSSRAMLLADELALRFF